MQHIKIPGWNHFETVLRSELNRVGHAGLVTARNFQTITFTEADEEVDRLQIALSTGTDRDTESLFWNVEGFDYEHDRYLTGKRPDEIIYAFTIDLSTSPYKVLHDATPGPLDITENLSEIDGIIVYDTQKLDRRTQNEYWFKTSALDAALLVLTVS